MIPVPVSQGARVPYTAACPCGFPDAEWASVLVLQSSAYGGGQMLGVVAGPACDVPAVAA